MSKRSQKFTLKYDGTALENHEMDIKDFAPSLLALGELFEFAGEELYGTPANLTIKATSPGSIDIELATNFINYAKNLLNSDESGALLNLIEYVGLAGTGGWSLIKLLKELHNKKITGKIIENGKTTLVVLPLQKGIDNQLEERLENIPEQVVKLIESIPVRKAINKFVQPLKKPGISSISSSKKHRSKIQDVVIFESEINCFDVPEQGENVYNTTETIKGYTIKDLSFENNMWKLYDNDNVVRMKMKDPVFKEKIDKNIISFAKNDMLKCRVKITDYIKKDGTMKTEYELLEVLDHMQQPKQLELFSN